VGSLGSNLRIDMVEEREEAAFNKGEARLG
jgi:hypothetical protein